MRQADEQLQVLFSHLWNGGVKSGGSVSSYVSLRHLLLVVSLTAAVPLLFS